MSISNLLSDTTYEFRIKPFYLSSDTCAGNFSWTEINFTTLEIPNCVEPSFDIPAFILPGNPTTFLNTSIDNSTCNNVEYDWAIYDENFNYISGSTDFDFTFTFTQSGTYLVELSPDIPGSNSLCCPNTNNSIPTASVFIDVLAHVALDTNIVNTNNQGFDSDINSFFGIVALIQQQLTHFIIHLMTIQV